MAATALAVTHTKVQQGCQPACEMRILVHHGPSPQDPAEIQVCRYTACPSSAMGNRLLHSEVSMQCCSSTSALSGMRRQYRPDLERSAGAKGIRRLATFPDMRSQVVDWHNGSAHSVLATARRVGFEALPASNAVNSAAKDALWLAPTDVAFVVSSRDRDFGILVASKPDPSKIAKCALHMLGTL